jgi:hypothetical protein
MPSLKRSVSVEKQVVSKERVTDHGEVYTNKREVNAMLDLVIHETENIESRFLEPACGTGNFLVEILWRKLNIVEARYKKSQLEYERYSVLAISSIYGVELLKDNVKECRKRLFVLFDQNYTKLYKKSAKDECRRSVKFLLERNIICGDALTYLTANTKNQKPIVFSEWSPVNGSMIKRRDFIFEELPEDNINNNELDISDEGHSVWTPKPVKEYPLTHFLSLADSG